MFEQNEAAENTFINLQSNIFKHQEDEIHQVLKDEQVMVCSSPF